MCTSSWLIIINFRQNKPAGYNDTEVKRSNPTAGSFSYSKGHRFTASRDISAGEEIFVGMYTLFSLL